MPTFTWPTTREECLLTKHTYVEGGTAIEAVSLRGEPYGRITTWIDGLAPDEAAIKDYSENTGVLTELLFLNIVQPPHRHVRSGFVSFPVCRINEPTLELFLF